MHSLLDHHLSHQAQILDRIFHPMDSFLCFLAQDKAGLFFGRDFHTLGGSEEKVFCPDDQINFCDKRDCYVV